MSDSGDSGSSRGPLERIVRKTGVPDIVEVLERLGATDLQSLLLEVYRRRAGSGSVAGLLERYRNNRFARPSAHPPEDFTALDHLAYSLLPAGFEAIELSTVTPLGTTALVTGTSQNRIVSTVRNSEVAADCTNALALECAVRRLAHLDADPRSREPVQLATSQRLMRAQPLTDPGHTTHFRLFGLCSAGRDTGSFSFELEHAVEHIGFHVSLLEAWREQGAAVGALHAPVTPLEDGPSAEVVAERVTRPLAERHPNVDFVIDETREQGRGYYGKLCFHVNVARPDGSSAQLADGGFTDWTQQLVGSKKERLMISGIGSERMAALLAAGRSA